jgi:HlyD family secretion protein
MRQPPAAPPGQRGAQPAPAQAPNVIAPEMSRASGAALPPPAPDSSSSIRLNGLVEPVRSQLVTAPRITGGGPGGAPGPQLQLVIVRLAKAGTMVRKGDLLVEFDRTSQLKNARDREAEYRDNLAQIDKKQAEQITAGAARQTGLKLAENAVRRAELDLVGVEMLPKITAEKNQQVLEEARAKLAQLRKTNALHERAAAADLKILEIQRDRSKNAWDHATRNASKMRIVSPLEGMVVLRSVFKSGSMAEMQEGEEVRPGIPILDVVDPSAMRVRAAVNQADVSSLAPGMPVRITLDSYPSRTFDGRLETLSPVATASMMSTRVRSFVAVFSIDGSDPHLLPDLAAAIEVEPASLEGSRR